VTGLAKRAAPAGGAPADETPFGAAPGPAEMVRAERVRVRFGRTEVLRGIDLTVRAGEVVCLIGPSGSGKTTFLRCVNHLQRVSAGRLWVEGDLVGYRQRGERLHELKAAEIARQRARIGMVFQRFNLFGHLTVLGNVIEAPVRVLGEPRAEVRERAMDLLGRFGMAGFADAYPGRLSGGQQQRVAIARALAMRPRLMLFDEPTSALDPELVGDILDIMRLLADDGMTMLVVTHEISFARDVADQIAFMDGGSVVECGPPAEVLDHPAHERTRTFLSKVR
jgi:polar amino acid transport system ATP-binding protein